MDWHIPVITMAFMAMDVLFGFVQACKNKCVDSTVMRDGLYHKVGFIGSIVLAYMCEYAMGFMDLGFSLPLVIPICVFIILTEVVSIIENLKKLAPELDNEEFESKFAKK